MVFFTAQCKFVSTMDSLHKEDVETREEQTLVVVLFRREARQRSNTIV